MIDNDLVTSDNGIMLEYWDYYRDDFDWNDDHERLTPDFDLTRARFVEMGYADDEVEAFIRSGYAVEPIADTVIIDRFYGGALMSSDYRTRIPARDFRSCFASASSTVPVYRARSLVDLVQKVEEWRGSTRRRLLFRGQIEHYPLSRERPNPHFSISDVGEVSLLPSLWRRLWKAKPMSFANFTPPEPVEWEIVLSRRWPVEEVNRRVEEINAAGGWIHSYQDMEDSDDPLLHKYGQFQLDISMGAPFNLADHLNTLLQHYGLLSPVLDLTSDLDVALFFATNQLTAEAGRPRYQFVGSNSGASILYVFRENPEEMSDHSSNSNDRVIQTLNPLRPVRQSCVICRSGPFALNLAADFLIGIIKIELDMEKGRLKTGDLFPDENDDLFLGTLKRSKFFAAHLTDFGSTRHLE